MKTQMMVGGAVALLLGGTLLLVNLSRGTSAPASPGSTAAKEATSAAAAEAGLLVEQLREPAAQTAGGRMALATEIRAEQLPAGTSLEAIPDVAREVLAKAAPRDRRQEKLLVSGESWRREQVFMDPAGKVRGKFQVVIKGGIGTSLEEREAGASVTRIGQVGQAADIKPVDHVLLGHAGELLAGATWTDIRTEGETRILTGRRGDERLTATVRTTPQPALERLLILNVGDPTQGFPPRGMELTIKYRKDSPIPVASWVQSIEFTTAPQPAAQQTTLTITPLPGASQPSASDFAVQFPQGTRVTDGSFDPPLRYTAPGKPLTEVALRAMYNEMLEKRASLGKPAPDWTLTSLDGDKHSLRDYRGKIVVMSFFASWCGPCNMEAPVLEKDVWQKHKGSGLVVLGVNTNEQGDQKQLARGFAQKHGVTYPMLLDTDNYVGQMYNASALPTTVIIDRKGKVTALDQGFSEEQLTATVEAALAAS